MAARKLPDISNIENKITISLYGGKSIFRGVPDSKYRAEVVSCNCNSCSLKDKGMCLGVTSIARVKNVCKYGERHIFEGYTPRAAACYEWSQVFKSDPAYNQLDSVPNSICFAVIGDYYFIDTSYVGIEWLNDAPEGSPKYKFDSSIKSDTCVFLEKEDADIDFITDLLKFQPRNIFGERIKEYSKNIVPLILREMQKTAPELYAALVAKEESLADSSVDFVGKTVFVKTLKPDIDITDQNGVFHLSEDRKTLTCKDYTSVFLPFEAKHSEITIPVTDKMTYKVKSNDEVCEDTEIA